jgi:terminase large subunit-like protein
MAGSTLALSRQPVELVYIASGAAAALMRCRAPEVLISGPAGTGKTRACLEKIHLCAYNYPRMRALVLRQTHASLTSTALVTYREKVLHPAEGVRFYGGSAIEPPQYRYPNGSRLMLGGLDHPERIMSSEYDLIYIVEATEPLEAAWEMLTTRLRNGVMPYQQLLADCNPGPPTHWLKQRVDAGKTVMLESRHEDNPALWGGDDWTAIGSAYMAVLDALSGVRKQRLRYGRWVAAEGLVYDGWDRAIHLVDRFPIPPDWPRFLIVDFGYTNPFVCQWWAKDPDGRLILYRELYRTQRLVEDHARDIARLSGAVTDAGGVDWTLAGAERPTGVICDHDAEDRATLERHLRLKTTAARKEVSPGIQAVASRLKVAGDGRPRLMVMRDALVAPDVALVDAKHPTCSEQEIDGYVWNIDNGRKRGEEPVKLHDHGMDCWRYLVAHHDLRRRWGAA